MRNAVFRKYDAEIRQFSAKMGYSVEKRDHSDWLINKCTHRGPIRLEKLEGQTLTRFGENKNILIHVKFDRYKENNKDINQFTSTLTFGQHQSGLAKLLKAINRGVRNEERLQP